MIFNIDVGMKSVTPSLDVNYPADVSVIAGSEASFTVFVTDEGFPKDHVLQWFVDGVAVEGATEPSYVRDTSGDKGQLSVWCEVTNKAGTTTSRRATLTVKKVPVLNGSYPANTNVVVPNSATFAVSVAEDGYPTNYSYQWYVNGAAVSGATGSRYTIAAPAGYRYIYCVVTNEAGSVQSRTATLGVSAKYFFSNGTFHYGGSYSWVGNSDTFDECGIENGLWYLKVDGGGHFAATWGDAVADLTGIRHVIFTVARTYAAGDPNDADEDIGWGRVGVVTSADLGNTDFVAGTSFRLFSDNSSRDYAIDVSHLNGYFVMKFVIDRTAQKHNQDWLYISAIRFE